MLLLIIIPTPNPNNAAPNIKNIIITPPLTTSSQVHLNNQFVYFTTEKDRKMKYLFILETDYINL